MTTAIAPAPAGETGELITHEWENDICTNPERVAIDFGAKGKGRSLTILVGCRADGTWFYGLEATTKEDSYEMPCMDEGTGGSASRQAALVAAANYATRWFHADKHCSRCLVGFVEGLGEKATLLAKMRAEAPEPRKPLPRARYADLPVAALIPNPENARKTYDAYELAELAATIRDVGLLQPVAVRLLAPEEAGLLPGVEAAGERYEIILGHRRHRAHVEVLKAETIECKIYEGVSRKEAKAAALIENLQRTNLNPIEEAEGYRDLMAAEELTQEQVALRVGRSRPVVANALRLLHLPAKVTELIQQGQLTTAHGLALARFRPKDEAALPNWRQIVEVIAEEAVALNLPAGSMEKGLPCSGALTRAGLVCRCDKWQLGNEWPEELRKHPAYLFEPDGWTVWCLQPSDWEARVAAHQEAQEKAREEERAARAAEVKKPTKLKSLQDLAVASVPHAVIDREDQALLTDLLPANQVREVDGYAAGEKATVCLAPKLAHRVEQALRDLREEDLKAKLPPLFEEARERIRKIRKVGPREQALLLALALESDEFAPRLSESSLKAQGVKLPAVLRHQERWSRRGDLSPRWLAAAGDDGVALLRVLLDDWLCRLFADDDWEAGEPALRFHFAGEDQRAVLRWLLEQDSLGLLDETKAGRKKLAGLVKALPWYAAALAQAEQQGDMVDVDAEAGADTEDEGAPE